MIISWVYVDFGLLVGPYSNLKSQFSDIFIDQPLIKKLINGLVDNENTHWLQP